VVSLRSRLAPPIDPGREKTYYEPHIRIAAPYCSIVAGVPLMCLVGWLVGLRSAVIVWLGYTVIDLAVLLASGLTLRIAALFALSFLTKLGAAYGIPPPVMSVS
jgi:hypothetical protein